MEIKDIEVKYLTVAQIATDAGVDANTVHNWLKYHRYLKEERLLGRPVVERTEYARFKAEHPHLIKTATTITAPAPAP